MGEVEHFNSALWFKSSATMLLILSGIIGSGICYFAIAVQREISATSFMVLQNCARMCVVVAGIVIFGDHAALSLLFPFLKLPERAVFNFY